MSIQGVFNTKVTDSSSMWVANAFVQFTAFLVCMAAWLFSDRTSFKTLLAVEPKYFLLGGVMGAFITLTVIKSMDALGPAKAVMLIVIAQIIVAYLIELGFSPVEIAERLGHESIAVTYMYSHLYPSKQVELADKLNRDHNSLAEDDNAEPNTSEKKKDGNEDE